MFDTSELYLVTIARNKLQHLLDQYYRMIVLWGWQWDFSVLRNEVVFRMIQFFVWSEHSKEVRIYRYWNQTWLVPLVILSCVCVEVEVSIELRLIKTALNRLDIITNGGVRLFRLDTLPNGLYTISKYSSCPQIRIIFKLGYSVHRASLRIPPKATSRGIGFKVIEDVLVL